MNQSAQPTPSKGLARVFTFPRLGVLGLLALAFALTYVLKGYQLFQGAMVLSYAIALLGLNLLTGYNGQISLGHGAFYALGAYAAGMLIEHLDMPYWLTVPCAGALCLVAGYLFGRPALKLDGLYLALATFALGIAMPQLLKYKALEPWTGGVQGLILTKPDAPWGLPLSQDQWMYVFVLIVTIIMFWLAHNMIESSTGRALRAIRDHALAAEALGVDNRHYKCMTFGISAAYTGVGGALSAIAVQYVSPDSFNLFLSISLLVGIVVGGVGTLWGGVFGAVFIMFVPTLAESISKAAPWAIYGVILILLMFLMPGGVVGLAKNIPGIHRTSRPPACPAPPISTRGE
ncbi:MAG: branched-chain amino acid ABC transporter permease [Desulfovibrionaceae bacterium]|nr:branched-chain amino acid ABC transporter permease [Desulfovibrionaceae bacterium]